MIFRSIIAPMALAMMALKTVSAQEFLFSDQGWTVKEIYEKVLEYSARTQQDVQRRYYVPSKGTNEELDFVTAEGQASAMLILGSILATYDTYGDAIQDKRGFYDYDVGFAFSEFFRGWVRMAQNSTDTGNCQPNGLSQCEFRGMWWESESGDQSEFSPCLPSKKFSLNATGETDLDLEELETGSNAAADADAILGMILAVKGAEKLDLYTSGWDVQVKLWLEQAIPKFIEYDSKCNPDSMPLMDHLDASESCTLTTDCSSSLFFS